MTRATSRAILLFAALTTGVGAAPLSERPNFILMIADDMGRNDCGAYGQPRVKTPNIDALARSGMRFDRAFVTASSCSPSRSSIITGRYPHNTDAEELHWPLPAAQTTFVEALRSAGYWTAAAGKWHLGGAVKDRFDVVREADPSGYMLPTGRGPGTVSKGDAASGCDQWVATLRDRPRDKPFFLWLGAVDPHRDYQPDTIPEPHRGADVVVPPYLPDVPAVRQDLARYYDEISRLDRFIGAVLGEVDRQGIADRTMVLFLSDNGRPFPRCKTTLYDSGISSPWIVRWPGRIKPGSQCSRLVSSLDIAPTLLSLAGLTPGPTIQGKDFSPVFSNPTTEIHALIFAERNWHDYAACGRAVRSERFKYIRNYDNDRPLTPPADAVRSPSYVAMRGLRDQGRLSPPQQACFVQPRPREELYDVDADPHELHNLAGEPGSAPVLETMRRALADWQNETGDRIPTTLSPDEFDRETGAPLVDRVRPRPAKKK
jgi:arylsulfatase A-like enzyme